MRFRFVMMFVFVLFVDIRRSNRPFLEDKTEDDFFQIDVSVRVLKLFF